MKRWILAAALTSSTALFGQTYAGLGFGVSTGAGLYAEHFVHPKWSVEANVGIPAVGFGVNYVLYSAPLRGYKWAEFTPGKSFSDEVNPAVDSLLG